MYWPLQENFLDQKSISSLCNFIKKNKRLTQFKKVKEFENKFAKWNGSKYSVFVNSGSSANLLIIQCTKDLYNWKNGDEVIVPAVTWPTTITPVIQAGLKPIFVDVNLKDFSYDYSKLSSAITKRTKAIFLAHLIGFPSDVKKIKELIRNKKIIIFEDCCESQGAKTLNKKVGNFGIGGSFSFYWGHHMSTIEGGMITTNNKKFYDLCLLKRSHGLARELLVSDQKKIKKKFPKRDFKFLFLSDGYNLRSTEINAFIGIQMLKKIDYWIKIRNDNYEKFIKLIEKYKKYFFVPFKDKNKMSSFVLPFMLKNSKFKKNFEKLLNKNGIESRPFIAGNLLKQPFLKNYKNIGFSNSNFVDTNCFYIGNNQFVNKSRLIKLEKILRKFF